MINEQPHTSESTFTTKLPWIVERYNNISLSSHYYSSKIHTFRVPFYRHLS